VDLEELGWNDFFADQLTPDDKHLIPARVARQDLTGYLLYSDKGSLTGSLPGKFRHDVKSKAELPGVGDWVLVTLLESEPTKAIIGKLMHRHSQFSRKEAGEQLDEQIIAANIDTAFIVCGLDVNINLQRLERYLLLAWESNATPCILLNKADTCNDPEKQLNAVRQVAPGVDINTISALTGEGIELLRNRIRIGQTGALLGSSGVGKSTIINTLLGFERFQTGSVREGDSKGRHTTTFREMTRIPGGGLIIDTPGMREIQVWGNKSSLSRTFDDLEELAARCRFRDCSHVNEPGCAIKAAIESGDLDETRLTSFTKLQRELQHLVQQQDIKSKKAKKSIRKRSCKMSGKHSSKRD
jgi:ribosome biogenesis GTPase